MSIDGCAAAAQTQVHPVSAHSLTSSLTWESQRFIFYFFIFLYTLYLYNSWRSDAAFSQDLDAEAEELCNDAPFFFYTGWQNSASTWAKAALHNYGRLLQQMTMAQLESAQKWVFLSIFFLKLSSLLIVINREKVTITVKPRATEKIQIFFDLMEICVCVCVSRWDKVDCSLWMWDEFSSMDELKVPNADLHGM